MSEETKTSLVLAGLAILFLGLAIGFRADLWGRVVPPPPLALVDPEFVNPDSVRQSAPTLIRTDGDTSGFTCYSCHDEGKRIELRFDEEENVILPEDHEDIVLQHGRNKRNNNCFNCHDQDAMDHLRTRDGRRLTMEQTSLLCASCHGPTYRDWEVGIHGRTSGYWNRAMGEAIRLDCTDCHNPHSPAFPKMAPAPKPNHLHRGATPAQPDGDH
jgi:nitrate/TMAO reductase-like tetraheme cytochrome c subunit